MVTYFNGVCWVSVTAANGAFVLVRTLQELREAEAGTVIPF